MASEISESLEDSLSSETSSLQTDPEVSSKEDTIHNVMPVQTEDVMMTEEPKALGLDQEALQSYF